MKESDRPEQNNDGIDNAESELESCVSDGDEPNNELSPKSYGEPSSKSPPTTNTRYPLRSRAGGSQPPNHFM